MDSTYNEQELEKARAADAQKAEAKAENVDRVTSEGDERAQSPGFPAATVDGEVMVVEKRYVGPDRVILVADTGVEYAQNEHGQLAPYDALAEPADAPAPVDEEPVDPEVPEQGSDAE